MNNSEQIFVDMDEVLEEYEDGQATGKRWDASWIPGGPFYFGAGKWESDRHKAIAKQTQANHDAWMQGWWDGAAGNPNCTQFKRPEYI